MNYLLDVNILVAWGWADHADHDRVENWIVALKKTPGTKLLTSAIPELGFVRVSIQRSRGQITADEAGTTLGGLMKALGKRHAFLPDDQTARRWPAWCQAASRTTDAHLLALAR
jgi:predicted nucleic acid-binding protein